MWDIPKAVLKEKFIALNTFIRKDERSKINHLSFYLRELEKEQIKSRVSRRKEILRIRTEIYEIENKKSIEKIK